jgi:hypothetical protein
MSMFQPTSLVASRHVLAAFADCQRELVFVDDDLHLAVLDVGDSDLVDLGGRQRVGGEY